MPIFLDGKEYEDEAHLEMATNPAIPQELKRVVIPTQGGEVIKPDESIDNNVVTPDKYQIDKKNANDPGNVYDDQGNIVDYDFSRTLPRMPLESPEKAPDALNLKSGITLPAEGQASPEPSNEPNAIQRFLSRLSIVNAVKGMTNPSTGEDVELIKGLWNSAKEAFKLPGEVFQGKIDPSSPEAINKSLDLATFMVFGPAPVAKKMADGTLGSFAGVTSKTLDKNKLYTAQRLEQEGLHPDDIWKQTGFFRGADKRWRYEIPDEKSLIREKGVDRIAEGVPTRDGWEVIPADEKIAIKEPKINFFGEPVGVSRLKDVLDHPELYKAYPEVANTKIMPMPLGIDSLGKVSGDTIYLKPMPEQQFKEVLTHEIQHIIQRKERFARGGSPSEFTPQGFSKAKSELASFKANFEKQAYAKGVTEETGNRFYDAVIHEVDDTMQFLSPQIQERMSQAIQEAKSLGLYDDIKKVVKGQRLLDAAEDQAFERYYRLAGEVEARNATTRMDMQTIERFLRSPRSTEDRPRFVQELKGDPGVSFNSGGAGVQYNLLGYLFGEKEKKPTEISGDKSTKFPSQEDAKYAIEQGFGYGSGLEPYINAEVARVYKELPRDFKLDERKSSLVDLKAYKNLYILNKVNTLYAQAALAANRSAIASLGFNPDKVHLDISGIKTNAAGFFLPETDSMWVNALEENKSTVVHESIHRGMKYLKDHSEEARKLISDLGNEEYVTRYLMYKTMGDPEKGRGDISDRQRQIGIDLFEKMGTSRTDQKRLERLEAIAAELWKERRPRGPK